MNRIQLPGERRTDEVMRVAEDRNDAEDQQYHHTPLDSPLFHQYAPQPSRCHAASQSDHYTALSVHNGQ